MLLNRILLSLSRCLKTGLVTEANISFNTRTGPSSPCMRCVQRRKAHTRKSRSQATKATRKDDNIKNDKDLTTVAELKTHLQEMRRKKCSYVFEESLADKLAQSIISNRVNAQAPIIEISPGIGVVSKALLNRGVEKVIALETEHNFHPWLQSLQQEYSDDKFEFHNWKMLNVDVKFRESGLIYRNLEALVVDRLSKSSCYDKETPYSVFRLGGIEAYDFLLFLLTNLPLEDPILSRQRVEFFFLVHPQFKISLDKLLPTNEVKMQSVYFSYIHSLILLLFDVRFLGEFEAKDFVPPLPIKGPAKRVNYQVRHLVRMQLKADIDRILPLHHLYPFGIFLKHVYRKTKQRIIPAVEMLIAGCGLRMLGEGFTMMETVADVSPDRLLHLYKKLVGWPEYSVSHLRNYILMETQGGPMEEEEEEEFFGADEIEADDSQPNSKQTSCQKQN